MRKFAFIKPLNYRMRKYIILFFSALPFLLACKTNKAPNGIIVQDKMINLMTAMHLVDGSLYDINASIPDSLYKYGKGKYVALFKRFNTDSTKFDKSLKYYTQHPDQLEIMYTKIMANLQAKNDSLNKVMKVTPPKTTSLKNALPPK
jgi:hypothetical protein